MILYKFSSMEITAMNVEFTLSTNQFTADSKSGSHGARHRNLQFKID